VNHTGRHFLQIPGPTNIPDRVLRAMDRPIIDHRGPEFAELALEILDGLRTVFKTSGPVVMFPASGTGAWEAAIVNTLSPGDHVLAFETGQFSTLWKNLAERMGVQTEFVPGNWRSGVDPDDVEARLKADKSHAFKAVLVVHNETSSGVKSRVAEIRRAMNRANHPALLMVDTISSLASSDYQHDEWEIDVSIGGSQKGLMLPPGLSFNAISEKARRAQKSAKLPRAYWDWEENAETEYCGFLPVYSPHNSSLWSS
jgi:alanine-glyoxylate transaminase / serine-glyoxylate transaminase / serine-pyruvate transaminase